MNSEDVVAIKVDDDYCGRCYVCVSICPYNAITIDDETGKVVLNDEKCQFCGICYSACPVNAIEIKYYSYDQLVDRTIKAAAQRNADTLVLMCRGNSPSTRRVEEILGNCASYVPLRVPCVGRIPPQFILKTLASGISEIIEIRCEEDFCRFKEGSRISNQRSLLLNHVLNELGYDEGAFRTVTYARKASYDADKCVGCDKCVFICPYEAIEVESFATPKIISDACVGCGACALVCPHQAIEIEGFEYEAVSTQIQCFSKAAEMLKSKGVSPIVLVFCCQWSEFSVLDVGENRLFENKAAVMEIPCFKGLDPYLVVEALRSGFAGVLAVVCSGNDCKLEKGYEVGERNVSALKRVLKELGLRDRFEIYNASPRNVSDFNVCLEQFIRKIKLQNTNKESSER